MVRKINEMFKIQDALNTFLCGDEWKKGECSKTGKKMFWSSAILAEVGELIDSFDYKHWKHGSVDIKNAQMEGIDILHFVLSLLLSHGIDKVDRVYLDQGDIKPGACGLEKVEPLLFNLISNVSSIDRSFQSAEYSAEMLVTILIKLLYELGMNFDSVYELYISKNVLNIFRNKNGYIDGTYIKDWGGCEDNVHLEEIMVSLIEKDELNYDNLYAALEIKYNEVKNK